MRHQRKRSRSLIACGAIAVTAGALLVIGLHQADAGTTTDPGLAGPHRVAEVDYTLGDKAFHVPGFHRDGDDPETLPLADIELTADVHYPADLGAGPYPLVVLSHGYWATCDDRAAAAVVTKDEAAVQKTTDQTEIDRLEEEITAAYGKLDRWPCAPGTPALPSYRGFDYVAQQLASQGLVVISISANGVNAGQLGDAADNARAQLINKHLDMWSQLVRTGSGPLAGKFTDPATGRPRTVDFRRHVDLNRVGTLGHSRGGRGVVYQAADNHRSSVPSGVHIAAVLALAPAGAATATNEGSPDAPSYRVTSAPLGVWMGSCDAATGRQGQDYIDLAAGHTTKPVYRWLVSGANHNFLNAVWSPSGGHATAEDDFASDLEQRGQDRPGPGLCGDQVTAPGPVPSDGSKPTAQPSRSWENVTRQLTETEERKIGAGYVTAFFARTLLGATGDEAILSGATHPYAAITKVDAERINPTH